MDEHRPHPRRAHVAARLTAALFGALGLRAANLQGSAPLPATAPHVEPRTPPRGRILDAHGAVLADDVPSHELDLDPLRVARHPAALDRLSDLLHHDADARAALRDRVLAMAACNRRVLRVRRHVDDATAAAITREASRLPGVWLTPVAMRRYPAGALTAFPVGHMSDPSPTERVEPLGYRLGDRVGRVGIERAWDLTLRGTSTLAPEHHGMTLALSLDLRLQRAAREALDVAGAVVALDASNGRVLAYVSAPSTDANAFERDGGNIDEGAARAHPEQPGLDRVADACSELPWVQVAPFLDALARAHGLGRDDCRPTARRRATERTALQRCAARAAELDTTTRDVGFVTPMLREFGFGAPTGVDLRDESGGAATTTGASATPLQLAVAWSALVNNGTRYQPRLVQRITHPDGVASSEPTPVVGGHVALPVEAAARSFDDLRRHLGTPTDEALYVDADDTSHTHAWSVALAPTDHPRLVVVRREPRREDAPTLRALVRAWLDSPPEGSR